MTRNPSGKILASVLFFLFFSLNIQAQEVKDNVTKPGTKETPAVRPVLPPLPVMKNTGNLEKDAADYAVEKDKWINEVLDMYSKSEYGKYLTTEQINKMREFLKTQNLDDLVQRKVVLPQ